MALKFIVLVLIFLPITSFGANECLNIDGKLKNVSLENRLRLVKSELVTEAFIKKSIELQLRHLIGLFRNSSNYGMYFSSKITNIKIINQIEVNFGRDLVIEKILPPERTNSDDVYTRNIIKKGKLQKNDILLNITYSASIQILDCKNSLTKSTKFKLPIDPYLAMWSDQDKKFTEHVYLGSMISRSSACVSNEIIEFGDHNITWYMWKPENEIITFSGKKKCIISESDLTIPRIKKIENVTIEKNSDLILDEIRQRRKISATFIVGVIAFDALFKKPNYSIFSRKISDIFELCRKEKRQKCLNAWEILITELESKKDSEPGLINFLHTLNKLHYIYDLDTYNLISSSENITLKIFLKSIDSKKEVELTAYFGTTSLDHEPLITKN